MNISDFSAWLQLFTGLNLAYAGSANFRNYVTGLTDKAKDLITLAFKFYERLYDYLTRKLELSSGQIPSNISYTKKFEKYKKAFSDQEKLIRYNSILEKDFTNKFKSIFFIATVVGICFLFLCGFQHKLDDLFFHKFLFTLNALTITYGILIFIISLFYHKIDRPLNLFVNIIILLLIYLVIFLFRNSIEYSSIFKDVNIVVSVLSITLPYIIFFVRKAIQFIYSIIYLSYILSIGCIKLIYIRIIVSMHKKSEDILK